MWDDDKTDYNCKSLWGSRWSSALPEAGAGSCAVCRLLKNDDMRNDPGHFLTPAGFRRPSLWSIILSDSYFHSSFTRAKKTNFSLCYLGISDMAGWIAERFFSSNFYNILFLLKFGGIFKFVRLSQSAYLKQTYYKTKQNKQDHLICAPIRWVRSKLDFTWKN